MALWALLILTAVLSFWGLSVGLTPEAREVAREQARTSTNARRGCAAAIGSLLLSVFWVWHAVEVGDWRYAALGLMPFVCTAIRMTIRSEWASGGTS